MTSQIEEQAVVVFKNMAPDDEEWTAHVNLLSNYTPADTQLRHIIGYIQAGPHYPKHMHQDLIEQFYAARETRQKEKWEKEKAGTIDTLTKVRSAIDLKTPEIAKLLCTTEIAHLSSKEQGGSDE